jgi:hypothetical protein
MTMNDFWAMITTQLDRLESAKTADEVIDILNADGPPSVGDAFFHGSGGNGTMRESLTEAGWVVTWSKAPYYWVMRAPDGSMVTYVEGDVYKGDRHA